MSLLTPLWLAGLAALAVPLVLHLWNRRPTTVVRIGSLRGLAGPPGPRSLGARLEDLPLLALRMAILASVAVGLAGLAVQRATVEADSATVLLVDPEVLADSLAVYLDPVVDRLRRSGVPVHLLAAGFPALDVGGSDTLPRRHPASDWALLGQLDDTLPPGSQVTVVTRMEAGSFGGMRPSLLSHYRFVRTRSADSAALTNQAASAGAPDTLTVEVVVGAGYAADSRAISAAWGAAIEAHVGAPPRIVTVHPDSLTAASDARILIWLADGPVPATLTDEVVSGATLVEFMAGEPEAVSNQRILSVPTGGAPDGLFAESVRLRSGVPEGTPILTDGSGTPLLTLAAEGSGRHYRVATRAGGDWSSLDLGSDLPELALLTLRGHRTGVAAAPVYAAQAATRLREPAGAESAAWRVLLPWLVLLAATLLIAERLVSHRRRGPVSA